MDLKVGDLVRLKSGGPQMTVISVDQDGIECTWFDNGGIKQHMFAPETLDKN